MSEIVTKEWLKSMLESSGRFGNHEVKICNFEAKRALAKGENYMTVPIRCHVIYIVDDQEGRIDLFLKMMPAGPEHRAIAEAFKVFVREATVYNELIPAMRKNVDSVGAPKECYPDVPISVFSKGTGADASICMEDLGPLGYRLSNRFVGATEEEARRALKAFAKFHANGIEAYRKGADNPEFAGLYDDPLDSEAARQVFKDNAIFLTMQNALSGFPGQAENAARLLKYINEECPDTCIRKFGELARFVGHPDFVGFRLGDCWLNNMMFRDETDENGVKMVAGVKLLDLQIVQKGSPFPDLQYFLGTSVNKAALSNRKTILREAYYPELFRVLGLLGSPLTQQSYPFDEFWSDFVKNSEFGLISAMFVLPIVMAHSNEIPDYDTGSDFNFDDMQSMAKDVIKADTGDILGRFAHLVQILVDDGII